MEELSVFNQLLVIAGLLLIAWMWLDLFFNLGNPLNIISGAFRREKKKELEKEILALKREVSALELSETRFREKWLAEMVKRAKFQALLTEEKCNRSNCDTGFSTQELRTIRKAVHPDKHGGDKVFSDLTSLRMDLDLNHPGCNCYDMEFWDSDETADIANPSDHEIWCPEYIMYRLKKIIEIER